MFNIKTGLLTGFNSNSKKNSNFTKIARISKVYSCGYFHSPKSDIPNQMFTFKRHCKKKKCPGIPEAGEGNGTPLQYSCLETPMDRGAW